MKGVIILFAAIALAAGSGVGWYYKSTLKLRSPVKPLLISLLIAVIAGVTYFVLAGSSPGMSAAIGVVVADALALAAIGVDRKRVGSGKSGSGRVDLGGRGIFKKKREAGYKRKYKC